MDAKQLTEGLTVKARPDGSVISVKDAYGKKTVAEVCVGTKRTRVNFREAPKGALAKQLGGKSKSWGGGGVLVDDENAQLVRSALLQAAGVVAPASATPKRKATTRTRRTRKTRVAASA